MDKPDDIESEERGIYLVILGAMIPIVLITAATRGVFGAGSTICLALLVLAILGLVSMNIVRRRARASLPNAQARSDSGH